MATQSSKKPRTRLTANQAEPAPAVTIRLRSKPDSDGEYGAFTSIDVDIRVNGTKAGSISATLIDRNEIPSGAFLMAMDGHSATLEWLGCRLYDRRRGRPKLRSMAEYDDEEFGILVIDEMHVDDEWKAGGASDVGAQAIQLLLHHAKIKGAESGGIWSVTSAAYVLDPLEAMVEQEAKDYEDRKEKEWRDRRHDEPAPAVTEERLSQERAEQKLMNDLARSDANQFLRNGFYQDRAVTENDRDDARILVATFGQWSQPLRSHEEVSSIQLYVPPPKPNPPTGKDSELLNYILSFDKYNDGQDFISKIQRIVSEGGSLLRSHTLHAAVGDRCNYLPLVDCILQMEPLTANTLDENGCTPLMHAAVSAAWRQNINGMPETHVIDRLLSAGARKDLTSVSGRTAFGFLVRQMGEMGTIMTSDNGWAGTVNSSSRGGGRTSGLREIALKLMPAGGPTAADLRGKDKPSGLIEYDSDRGGSDLDD